MPLRTICFVTGTRAEFGLMESTLRAIRRRSRLQIVATGMHLSRAHGKSLQAIRDGGWKIDAIVPWKHSDRAQKLAESTGLAIAHLSGAFTKLKPDIVLIVGDRVEAFAAAAAAHFSGIIVAHVHGGDRALGQVDDSLRHAITKLAHIHFPATKQSAARIKKLGEDPRRIHRVGSPGIDGIVKIARSTPSNSHQLQPIPNHPIRSQRSHPRFNNPPHPNTPRPCRFSGEGLSTPPEKCATLFALIILHPVDADASKEFSRAQAIYRIAQKIFPQLIVIYPNNDPGSPGIIRCWQSHANDPQTIFHRNLPRANFLALLRDAAVLIGNSSSGIIEAASFGTPVLDIGPRQQGRERGPNVLHADYSPTQIRTAIKTLWNNAKPVRFPHANIYGNGRTSEKIAAKLAAIPLDEKLLRKLIAY